MSFLPKTSSYMIKIKRCLGGEVRKVVLSAADEPTLDDLYLMCQRLFSLSPSKQFDLKYIDSDGDEICLKENEEVVTAFAEAPEYMLKKSLRLNLYEHSSFLDAEEGGAGLSGMVSEMKKEVGVIQEKLSVWCQKLDRIEETIHQQQQKINQQPQPHSGKSKPKSSKSAAVGKEFDPYQSPPSVNSTLSDAKRTTAEEPHSEFKESSHNQGSGFVDNQVNDLSSESPPANNNNSNSAVSSDPPRSDSVQSQPFSGPPPTSQMQSFEKTAPSGAPFKPNVYPQRPSAGSDQLNNLDVSQLDSSNRATPVSMAEKTNQGVSGKGSASNSLASSMNSMPPFMPSKMQQPPNSQPQPYMNSGNSYYGQTPPTPPPSSMSSAPNNQPPPSPGLSGMPPPPPTSGGMSQTGPPSMNIPRGQMMYPPKFMNPQMGGAPGLNMYGPPQQNMMTRMSSTPLQTPPSSSAGDNAQNGQNPSGPGGGGPSIGMNGGMPPPPSGQSPFMPPVNYPAPRGSLGMPPPPPSSGSSQFGHQQQQPPMMHPQMMRMNMGGGPPMMMPPTSNMNPMYGGTPGAPPPSGGAQQSYPPSSMMQMPPPHSMYNGPPPSSQQQT